ncbi:MAG: uracil-DNA glycosylase [Lettuce witches'-broom phytoplasma]
MWKTIIEQEKQKNYFQKISLFLEEEYNQGKEIFPPQKDIFNAFEFAPWEKVKVVILGQDPYPGVNQAHGLSFSVLNDKTPASLRNIFKELKNDLSLETKTNNLSNWAFQGVLLLNAILTVEKGKPLSHSHIGWQNFTKNILKTLNRKEKIVYILWGKFAQTFEPYIDADKNYIIKSTHPSPLSSHRGFFDSQPFSKTNQYLAQNKIPIIDWSLTEK